MSCEQVRTQISWYLYNELNEIERTAVEDHVEACGACAAGSIAGGTYFTGIALGHSIVFGTLAAERIVNLNARNSAGSK